MRVAAKKGSGFQRSESPAEFPLPSLWKLPARTFHIFFVIFRGVESTRGGRNEYKRRNKSLGNRAGRRARTKTKLRSKRKEREKSWKRRRAPRKGRERSAETQNSEGKERRSQSRRRSPPDSPFVPSEKGAGSDPGERSVRGFCLFLRGEHVVN